MSLAGNDEESDDETIVPEVSQLDRRTQWLACALDALQSHLVTDVIMLVQLYAKRTCVLACLGFSSKIVSYGPDLDCWSPEHAWDDLLPSDINPLHRINKTIIHGGQLHVFTVNNDHDTDDWPMAHSIIDLETKRCIQFIALDLSALLATENIPFRYFEAVSAGQKIFLWRLHDDTARTQGLVYDCVDNQWKAVQVPVRMVGAIHYSQPVHHSGALYFFGGGSNQTDGVVRYDIASGLWEDRSSATGNGLIPRFSPAVVVLDKHIMLCGGGRYDGPWRKTAACQQYDPGRNTYRDIAHLTVDCQGSDGIVVDGQLLLLGRGSIERYDAARDRWTLMREFPFTGVPVVIGIV